MKKILRSAVLPTILTAHLTGCTTPQPVEHVSQLHIDVFFEHDPISKQDMRNNTIAEIRQDHLTPQALEALEDIPVVSGISFSPAYTIGANGWSRIAGLFTGSGTGDKIVLSQSYRWGALELRQMLIHEYMHHAIERNILDVDAFNTAYTAACKETYFITEQLPSPYEQYTFPQYIADRVSRISLGQDIFGVGDLEEATCHASELLLLEDVYAPEALRNVYRDVLIMPPPRQPSYTPLPEK